MAMEAGDRVAKIAIDRSRELVALQENICPVTGLPFETVGVRQRVASIWQEAIDQGKTVVAGAVDLDNLKGLNDKLGHDGANVGLRIYGQNIGAQLLGYQGVETILVYRPQAGGDEYKYVAVGSWENAELVKEELGEMMGRPVVWRTEGGEEIRLSGTNGTSVKNYKGALEPEVYEEIKRMEIEANRQVEDKKRVKTQRLVEGMVMSTRGFNVDEFIKEAQEIWGTRRATPEVMGVLLKMVQVKQLEIMTKSQTWQQRDD
jgi:GGDEF domain-containing protein